MATLDERFEAAATKAEDASEIGREWANGDDTTIIQTESGPLPSLAKFLSDNSTQIDTNDSRITTIENQNLDTRLIDEELETTRARAEQKLRNNAVVYLNFTEDEGFQHNDLSVTRNNATGLINYTCSTTATGQTADGRIVEVAPDTPRIVWNNGKAVGLLNEPSSENLLLWSKDFTNAVYSKYRSSIETSTSVLSPDGSNFAQRLVEDTTDDDHSVTQSFTANADIVTFSCYAKAAERQFVQLVSEIDGSTCRVNFDLLSEQINFGGAIDAGFERLGGGWFRVWFTANSTPGSSYTAQIRVTDTLQTFPSGYQGDGVSGIYIWQAQVEGSTKPTSPIFTGSSTSVRGVSVSKIQTSLNENVSFFCDFDYQGGDSSYITGAGTASNSDFLIARVSSGAFQLYLVSGDSLVTVSGGDKLTFGRHKVFLQNNGGEVELWLDGSLYRSYSGFNSSSIPDISYINSEDFGSVSSLKSTCAEYIVSAPLNQDEAIALTTLEPEA